MRNIKQIFGLLLLAVVLIGCSKEEPNVAIPAPDAGDKYKNGFYVLNEGQFGTSASINYYSEGAWSLNLFRTNNEDQQLGMIGRAGVCKDDMMYIVTMTKPFLIKVGLADFVLDSELDEAAVSGQGCSFALLDNRRGVLTTSAGAHIVTLDPLSVDSTPFSTQSNSLGGDVLVSGGYIFLLGSSGQGRDVMVYDATTLQYVKSVGKATTGFAMAAGSVWAANGTKLLKINTSTLVSEEIELGEGLKIYYNPWNYVPSGLKASQAGDAIYFVNASTSGNNGRDIYKYVIATGRSEKFFTAPIDVTDPEKPLTYGVYGAGVAVNPNTGDVYLVYSREGFGTNYLVTDIYQVGADGKLKARIPYTRESETVYWFPSMLIFR